MNTVSHDTELELPDLPAIEISPKGSIAVLPVPGLPGADGADGENGQPGPPGDSVLEDPPINLVTLFENALI